MVPLRWPASSGGADEYEDKEKEQTERTRVEIRDTERARVVMRETDSPQNSVRSEADYHKVSKDRSPGIVKGDVIEEGIIPCTSRYLSEFHSQVEKEVECAVRGLESSLGPAWEPPKSKRTTGGEFSSVAAVRFINYVKKTVNHPATLGQAMKLD